PSLSLPTSYTSSSTPVPIHLSLHDALPIYTPYSARPHPGYRAVRRAVRHAAPPAWRCGPSALRRGASVLWCRAQRCRAERQRCRSEEHTSELQSRFDLVCRLLLEKKYNPIL